MGTPSGATRNSREQSFEELWARAQGGCQPSTELLCLELASLAKVAVSRLQVEVQLRDDVVQGVVSSVLEGIAALDCPTNSKGFVWWRTRSITRTLRQQSGRFRQAAEDEESDVQDHRIEQPFESLQRTEARTALWSCIEELPVKQRNLMQMRLVERVKIRDLTARHSVSAVTIRSWLRNALSSVHDCMTMKGVTI